MLGSLEDYLAPPGALRLHAKDDEWKTRFDERARRAACIIVEVSKSDNLLWECEHLRSEGFEKKLFLLTRPSKEGIALPVGLLGNAVWRMKGIRTITWPEFATDLKKLVPAQVRRSGRRSRAWLRSRGRRIRSHHEGKLAAGFRRADRGMDRQTKEDRALCLIEMREMWPRDLRMPQRVRAPLCYDCRARAKPAKRAWRRMPEVL